MNRQSPLPGVFPGRLSRSVSLPGPPANEIADADRASSCVRAGCADHVLSGPCRRLHGPPATSRAARVAGASARDAGRSRSRRARRGRPSPRRARSESGARPSSKHVELRFDVSGHRSRWCRGATSPELAAAHCSPGGEPPCGYDPCAVLTPGTVAPDFDVADQWGGRVRLRDLRGTWVVLWWYPKAATSG